MPVPHIDKSTGVESGRMAHEQNQKRERERAVQLTPMIKYEREGKSSHEQRVEPNMNFFCLSDTHTILQGISIQSDAGSFD